MLQKQVEITVLCENSVASSSGLTGEHGWAVGVATETDSLLFDTGQGIGILNNCDILAYDLSAIDKVVLSHGHYDHCSGLSQVLQKTGPRDVYVHPDAFGDRFSRKKDRLRDVGVHFKKKYLESLGATFRFNREFTAIGKGIYLSGEIPRCTDFEELDPTLLRLDDSGRLQQDPFNDDQTLIIDCEQGLVLILGCAHAGLINILHHVQQNLPNRPVYAVVGGTHLGFSTDEQFTATVKALEPFNIQCLAAGHCTGLERGAQLAQYFGDRFRFAPVGTKIALS